MTRKKNPLYVVTQKGSTVEMANGLWDGLVKRFGLGPAVDFLEMIWKLLLEQVNNYAMLVFINELFESWIEQLAKVLKTIDPILAFTVMPDRV